MIMKKNKQIKNQTWISKRRYNENSNHAKNKTKTKSALRGVAIQRGRAARTTAVFPPAGASATAFRLPTPLATAAAASSANALHGFAP